MKKKMKTTLFKLEQDRWGIYWVEVPPTDGAVSYTHLTLPTNREV